MQKIMFNDKFGLTKAVLDGLKTKTRRIITIDEVELTLFQTLYFNETFDFLEGKDLIEAYYENNPQKIPYKKGEIVAVAQKYSEVINPIDWVSTQIYEDTKAWNNKMFVRPDLMPHQVRMIDFHIERLQEISDEDCMAEGIIKWDAGQSDIPFFTFKNSVKPDYDTPREAYAALMDKISGKGTWERNPFVFAYDFKLWK
nr:MAG TPA_asm: ASCH domain protein [Caudoviricetes sp.]